MSLHSRNFLPFHIKKESPPPIEIETRPGLEPEDDVFDLPYRFNKVDKVTVVPKSEPRVNEYHHGNMTFWWFIMGAILISFFLFIVEYSENGVRSEFFSELELFPGSPDPVLIFLGNSFLFFMAAWSAYHMFKQHNTKIVRYGGIFLMVGVFILVLMWGLLLFSSYRFRAAMLYLIIATLVVIVWIILSKYNEPDNNEILLPLGLGLIWLIYLLYYTLGIINKNDDHRELEPII